MPRRLANALTLLSAVVCVLSLLLVGRSFFYADSIVVPIAVKGLLEGSAASTASSR